MMLQGGQQKRGRGEMKDTGERERPLGSRGNQNIFKEIGRGFQFVISHTTFGPLSVLALIFIIFTVATLGTFASIENIQIIFSLSGLLAIMALGSSLAILIGSIDLSLEGVMAISSMVCGLLLKNPITNADLGFLVLPIVMVIGATVGFINGVIITKIKIPSFMVTLGMGYATLGLAVIIGKGATIQILDTRLQTLANGNIIGIPYITLVAVALLVITMAVQRRTALGKYIFAIGGNETLALMAGIRIDSVKIIVFTISGCLYGISAFFLVSRLLASSTMISTGYLFPSITAAVVGGTALSGGIGGALNAFIGAMVVTGVNNGMVLLNVNPYAQGAVNGTLLIIAVALTIDRKKIGIIK
jgi:ribose/xylose/arabinose/galactoside ABC-type transport system permease subunit